MTRIVVACAPFKGTFGAVDATRLIASTLRSAGHDVDERPLPDGGEGTADVIARAWGFVGKPFTTRGRLGQTADAIAEILVPIGERDGARTALIESATCVGLGLVAPAERRPRLASSRSLGLLMKAVIDDGVTHVVMALGGTGTVDGGRGLLEVLPCLPACVRLTALVDVQAPLVGAAGARAFFAQKGLPAALHDDVEAALATLHPRWVDTPGAGAAGGLGAAMLALGGTLRSGADTVIDATDVAGAIAAADVVVGGEGAVDVTTTQGKSLWRLRALAQTAQKQFIVVCGRCALPTRDVGDLVVELGEAGVTWPAAALVDATATVARWMKGG